jgi:hypothetical protein
MSKIKIIFILGIWVAILSYLGFPYSLKNILFFITGLGIMYLCYLLYRDLKVGETKEKTFDNFSENGNFNKNEIKSKENPDLHDKEI